MKAPALEPDEWDGELMHEAELEATLIRTMQVEVTIGVQRPDQVDIEAVRKSLPYGIVTAKAVKGGLDVPPEETHDLAVIATAAIAVRLDLP